MGDESSAEVVVLSDVLTLVAERAPKLREAGVLHLRIDGFDLDLAPADPPEPTARATDADDVDEEPEDPLDDPFTYGTKSAPGFAALRDRKRKQEG